VAGAKLILVMGHTRCGAVTAAVQLAGSTAPAAEATGCQHVEHVLEEIQESFTTDAIRDFEQWSAEKKRNFVDKVARDKVSRMVRMIPEQSETPAKLARAGRILIVGALYDVATGDIELLGDGDRGLPARAWRGAEDDGGTSLEA